MNAVDKYLLEKGRESALFLWNWHSNFSTAGHILIHRLSIGMWTKTKKREGNRHVQHEIYSQKHTIQTALQNNWDRSRRRDR